MPERMKEIWRACFGDPEEYLDLFFKTAYSPDRCLFTGDAMAFWFDCSLEGRRLAYVYALAVAPDKQGRGLGTQMLQDLHRLLAERGYDGVLLVPGEESLFRFYESFGYETVSFLREATVKAGEPADVRRIDAGRFALLRRQYPVVLQEGENLALLEAMAEFYEGDGFLAAVNRREKCCLELLGDEEKAPGLVSALGMEECAIRLPGSGRPFAMGRSLTADPLPRPLHFGFAFD